MDESHTTHDTSGRLQSLLNWSERIGRTGSWEYVPSENVRFWSDNLFRIFGLKPEAGTPLDADVLALIQADDRARVDSVIATFFDGGEDARVEYRLTRPDGERRHLRSTLVVAERRDGQPYRMIALTEDLTERRHAEREIAAHVAVAEALDDWEDLESGAPRLLSNLAGALDCLIGVFWVPSGDFLIPRVLWHESSIEPEFAASKSARALPGGHGLAARAWESRAPLSWTNDEPAQSAEPPDSEPRGKGPGGAFALPALAGDEVLAIIELRADREIRVSERLLRSLYGISHELGLFLARRGGELNSPPPLLTAREVEMLQLAAHGLSAKETGDRLFVSPATVKTHLENIYRKLAVSGKPSAVATGMRLGLID